MEDIFSSNSENIIQKKLDIIDINSTNSFAINSNEDLDFYFDIDKIIEWVKEKDCKRIALQFPDELLKHSILVCSKLKEKLKTTNENYLVFILGDTSYGSCCVDLVAAEHCNADCVIHFGHTCLSPVEKLPVFYVLEKCPLNLDSVKKEIEFLFEKNTDTLDKVIILYDVCYYYLYEEILKRFCDNKNIYISNIDLNKNLKYQENNSKIIFSRVLPNDLKNNADSPYSFFYIGARESFLNSFLFYFNKMKFFNYNPKKINEFNTDTFITESILFSKTNKELMKRYFLIEKARDSNIFGILIGTMSVSNYVEAIDHVSLILKKANRRFYSFLIGKLNCPKLNNFMEVDMYVLVACNENSLINSKELNKPIITIYELEIAFNCARLWGEEFICDYRQLLPGKEHYLPIVLSEQESDVSLITGGTRILNSGTTIEENLKNKSSLLTRESTLAIMHHSGAGEFLQSRTWTGLEQNLGQTEVTKAVEGKKGIAAGYLNELE